MNRKSLYLILKVSIILIFFYACKKDNIKPLNNKTNDSLVSEAKLAYETEFKSLHHYQDYLKEINWGEYDIMEYKADKIMRFSFKNNSNGVNSFYYYVVHPNNKTNTYIKMSSSTPSYENALGINNKSMSIDTLVHINLSKNLDISTYSGGFKMKGLLLRTESNDFPLSCNNTGCHSNGIPLHEVIITPGGGITPPPDFPWTWTGGGGYYHGYGTPTVQQVKGKLMNKPFALTDVNCELAKSWLKTANFKPEQAILDKLNRIQQTLGSMGVEGIVTSTDVARIQKIDDAYSSVVNMDFFPIQVDKLPYINGRQLTAGEFLHHIRTNFNSFIDGSGRDFYPYNAFGVNDTELWKSNNPYGAIIGIDLYGPDNASVITSFSSSDKWTFTTIHDPKNGDHPVSGNRDFGYVDNQDGSYTYYVRGVDRLTSWDGTAMQSIPEFFIKNSGVPFNMADNLWKSYQQKVQDFSNSHGGNASIPKPIIYRPDWQKIKDVLDGKRPLKDLSNDCPN